MAEPRSTPAVLFVGEAPSPSTDGRPGAAPLVGETGLRLARWAGLSPAAFRARAACTNLFDRIPQRWDEAEARARAAWMWGELTSARPAGAVHEGVGVVVLLGARVARAFGATRAPLYATAQTAGPALATMPHPSGLNHYWNEAAHVRRAERFLRRLLGQPMPGRQPRLPMGRATWHTSQRR